MLFNSYVFIFAFLPAVIAGYYLCARFIGPRPAVAWLVAASVYFYGFFRADYVLIITGSMIVNYAIGVLLGRRSGPRRTVLTLGVGANLALLGYYKYAGFGVSSFNAVLGAEHPVPHIVLPLAISFFTFQQIAYLVDAFRRETEEHNFIDYCLFVTFFPQLIAGPIVHHAEMLPQFASRRPRLRAEHLSLGISIFTVGLFKKVALADPVSAYANPMFDAAAAGTAPTLTEAWLGSLAYACQIYYDFSGYSDMAVGLGLLFGVRLPINFNSPYKATSVVDFWRRWHITLSRFLRDYLYFPLGGNRRGKTRRYVNLMITMLLGGLWHGAAWTFVLWGGLHGLYLVINRAWWAITRRRHDRPISLPHRAAATLGTFLAVLVAWVFFRAEGFDAARRVLEGMAGSHGTTSGSFPLLPAALWCSGLTLGAFLLPNTAQLFADYNPVVDMTVVNASPRPRWWRVLLGGKWRPNPLWALVIAAMFLWSVLNLQNVHEFLYRQF